MMHIHWDILIALIYFFYGLAFYSMGFALFIESGRASELEFARSMRLLAGFGLLHGTHEWLIFSQFLLKLISDDILPLWSQWIRVAILVASFVILLSFGEHLRAIDRKYVMRIRLIVFIFCLYALSCIVFQIVNKLAEADWIIVCDVLARYIIGIPASVVAGLVLYHQGKIIENNRMRQFSLNFTISAVSLIIYGVIGQVFVHETSIYPANIINENLFLDILGFPIQLLRAFLAVIIAVSMIRALRVLEIENEQRLEAIDNARRETERRNHDELARLNASLKTSEAEARLLLEELKQRDNSRTEFLQQVTAAQESERKRIARELHDGTGQMLTGLALGLRGLSTQVSKHPNRVIKRLSELESMATNAIGELRNLIQDLRPPQLDDMGLIPAIRVMLERFKKTDGACYELEINGKPYPLSSEVETFLFRIIQEGVTNVSKHAKATCANVRIDYGDSLHICVCDDGIGCDPETVLKPSTPVPTAWGLHGIGERANLINATWTLESEPGKGTRLKVMLPVQVNEGNAYVN